METETPKTTSLLEIAWMRFAQLDASSLRRTNAHKRLRIWIAALGVLATVLSILVASYYSGQTSVLAVIIKNLFIITPIVASLFAAFGTRTFANSDWLITRAAAEEYLKEIYFYRTILRGNEDRRAYLEKRSNEIQRQLYRGLGGEFAFRPYSGPLPPASSSEYQKETWLSDLTAEEYFKFRLEDQLNWHIKEVNKYKRERGWLTFFVLAAGGLGTYFAALGGVWSAWVAFTASITAALVGWQQLRNLDIVIKNYSKVILELTSLYDHWNNLEPEERTTTEYYKMVRGCEDILWAQNTEYIKAMQEALRDRSLEEEGNLVNRVIRESIESDERIKQAAREDILRFTRQALDETEQKVEQTFQAVLGSLAEEASSEIVRNELEAMSQAVAETVEDFTEQAAAFNLSLEQIALELEGVDLSRDTSKEELNAVLARYPTTGEVKG